MCLEKHCNGSFEVWVHHCSVLFVLVQTMQPQPRDSGHDSWPEDDQQPLPTKRISHNCHITTLLKKVVVSKVLCQSIFMKSWLEVKVWSETGMTTELLEELTEAGVNASRANHLQMSMGKRLKFSFLYLFQSNQVNNPLSSGSLLQGWPGQEGNSTYHIKPYMIARLLQKQVNKSNSL